MKKPLLMIGIALVTLLGFTACEQIGTEANSGRLHVSLVTDSETSERNIDPEGSEPLQLVRYSIQGNGPNTVQVGPLESDSQLFTIGNLTVGLWTFTAVGYNSADVPVAQGNVQTTIDADENYIEIKLDTMVGSGSFSLVCNWNPDYTATDSTVLMKLIDYSGNTVSGTTLEKQMDLGRATLAGTDIPAGYYTVSVQISSAGEILGGFVETVRIIDSTLTNAERTLELGKVIEAVEFTIIDNTAAPVDGTLSVSPVTPVAGSSATLSFSPDFGEDPTPSELSIQWYVNGTLIQGANDYTYTITSVPGGTTRYDVVVGLPESGSVGSKGIELHADVEPSIL